MGLSTAIQGSGPETNHRPAGGRIGRGPLSWQRYLGVAAWCGDFVNRICGGVFEGHGSVPSSSLSKGSLSSSSSQRSRTWVKLSSNQMS